MTYWKNLYVLTYLCAKFFIPFSWSPALLTPGVSVSPKMLKMRLFRSRHTPASPGTGWSLSGGSEWAHIWKRLQCRLSATNPLPILLGLSSVTLSCLPLGSRRKETSFIRPTPSHPCSFWFWHQQSHRPWWLVPESLFQLQQDRKTNLRPPNCANDECLEISRDGSLIQFTSLNFRLNQCLFQPTLIFIKHST